MRSIRKRVLAIALSTDCWTARRRAEKAAVPGASQLDPKSNESGAEGTGGSEAGSAPAPHFSARSGRITGDHGGRVGQVVKQTRMRIFAGDTKSPGKIVSVFEPHTEIIRKGKASKPNEFGKLVKIQEAENQIVTHFEVYAERPADSTLLLPSIEVHQQRLGRIPRTVAADAGFYSRENEKAGQALECGGCRCPTRKPQVANGNFFSTSVGFVGGKSGEPARRPNQRA